LIKHGEFTEKIAPLSDLEHNAFACVVFQEEFCLALAHDVNGVTRVPVVIDYFAGRKSNHVEFRGEFCTLVLVQQIEQGNLF
jgi:hypothetical protein